MGAAGRKRNAKVATQEGRKRDRALMKGRISVAKDNPTQPADFGRELRSGAREGCEGLGNSHAVVGFDPRGW